MNVLIGYMIDGRNGGIDKYLLRVLALIHNEGIHADILTTRANADLAAALAPYGAGMYEISTLARPVSQLRQTEALIRSGVYDAAYFNISEPMNCIGIFAAHRCGVRKVIVHSHNSQSGETRAAAAKVKGLLNRLARPLLSKWGTDFYACSQLAGQWMFEEKICRERLHVIYNPVSIREFAFNAEKRAEVRRALGLEDACVIGHVGNFLPSKNSMFLLDILAALLPDMPEAVLLSVGDGPEREAVMAAAARRGLDGHIRFMGIRDDVPALLQGMDFFVLPSRYEGLPVSAIEAQAAGLKTLLADTISREVRAGEGCDFLSTQNGGGPWAEKIKESWPYQRMTADRCLAAADRFDIEKQKAAILAIFQ